MASSGGLPPLRSQGSGDKAQSTRNDEETDAHLRVGLLKSYVRQGRTVLGIKPPHYLREKEQGWTDRKGRFVSLSVCLSNGIRCV